MIHRSDGARFPPDVTFGIQTKAFNVAFIRPENLVSHGQCPLGAFVECCRVVLLKGSPISTEELWSSVRVTIVTNVTSMTNALLPRLLSLAGRPALGRVLVVPNFFHFRMMEAIVFLETFNAVDIFWYHSLDLCLDTILSWLSTDNSFDVMAWFLI